MKVTIESTTKIVNLINEVGSPVPCRLWEGTTERGVKVHVFVPRIAALADQDLSQFEEELRETRAPSPEVEAYPLRLVL